MKRLCFVLLALVLLVGIVGCGDKKTPDKDGDDTEAVINTPVIEPDSALSFDQFRLVRSDTSSQTVTDAAVKLRKAIMSYTKSMPTLVTDWTAANGSKEILIGDTNRRAAENFKLSEFRITCEDGNIYILAGSDAALSDAVDYFIENLLCENGILMCEGYKYVTGAQTTISSISAGGTTLGEVYVYGGDYGVAYVNRIIELVKTIVGAPASATENESVANIMFTDSNAAVEDGKWGIVGENGKILLVAGDEVEAKNAYNKLADTLKNTTGKLEINGLFFSDKQMTREEYRQQTQLVIYPEFPEQMNRIYDYDVSVTMNGKTEKLPVYNHTVDSNVSRRPGLDEYRRFSMFAFSGGQVRVDIKVKQDFTSYTVFPSAKNFKSEFKDGVISVYLDEPDYFGIQLDDDQNTILSVFADYPEFEDELPDDDDPNFIRIEGWYETEDGTYLIEKDYTTVYIAPGSVLNARVKITGNHCKVIGHGAIVDPFENIYEYDIREGGTEGKGLKMLIVTGTNNYVEGVTAVDARCFNYLLGGQYNVLQDVKALSSMMTTDGITATGKDIEANHCWLYVGDNGIVFSAKNFTANDITIGTTCSSLFPQGSPTNCLLENINVFRTDDDAFRYVYNPAKQDGTYNTQTASVTVRNYNALELPTGREGASSVSLNFFDSTNMGTAEKVFNFENVTVNGISNSIRYRNGDSYFYSEGYLLNFKNYCENGILFRDYSEFSINNPKNANNEETLTYDAGYKAPTRNEHVVNYTAKNKVYIGALQVFFDADVTVKGDNTVFPTEEICELLRVSKVGSGDTVTLAELKKAGVVTASSEKQGALYLTPVYKGANLFLPDKGEVSMFSENVCYQLDVITSEDRDGIIYTACANPTTPNAMGLSAGICRKISDEVKMYGEGTYRLSFSVMAPDGGSLRAILTTDAGSTTKVFGATNDWTNITLDYTISADALDDVKIILVFCSEGSVVQEFSFRDFSFTKVS
ncbi:MAG: hypothetical protein ACI4QZ_07555 [Eubacteriales bacterium]